MTYIFKYNQLGCLMQQLILNSVITYEILLVVFSISRSTNLDCICLLLFL